MSEWRALEAKNAPKKGTNSATSNEITAHRNTPIPS